ncbi:PGF-pre-PGF domain-containing protein [Methanococcoides methylutens]|uniref:PGF-pre-PGF domain-containing protein n=1 Tax=Methanococcoides methylutens TaxID=2226 RepID=UPI004044B0DB
MKIYVMIFVILLTLMTTTASAAEGVAEDWNVTFNSGYDDVATSVQQTSDEGYIIAGYTNNSADRDMWLVKTNETGSELWNVTFNCNVTDFDLEYSVQQTSDDGYIVAGTTETGSNRDMWLVKTNETGSEEWNVTFDSGSSDYATSVNQTKDGGYIVTGHAYNGSDWNMWLVKTNETGSELWNVTFDSGYDDFSRSVQQTSDSGYIVTGSTNYSTGWDIWLVKANETGSELWNVTFNGGYKDHAFSVQQTSDSGYIVAGYAYNDTNRSDMWLVKTNDTGSELWNVTIHGQVEDDGAYSVQQTDDDGYILAGYTENDNDRDMWLVKTNETGSELWNLTFDGGHDDHAYSVQQTPDGYILAGYKGTDTDRDMWLVKVNENHAPVLEPIGDKSVNENKLLTFTVIADDVNSGDILNYTSDNLPTGATLNNSTGVFLWTPSESQVGVYPVNFTVSDGSLNDSEIISITVNNVKTGGSSSSGSSSGGGGGGASGEAYENIAFKDVKTENIIDGHKISYVFDKEQNAIQYVNFSALRNYGRVSTTIEMLKDRSSIVDESAPGIVYGNFNIWVGKAGFATENNIADPVIGFRVAKEWITENRINVNSIVMYRHNEAKWNALNTEKIGEDDSYIYFEADTPGFSPFAIAADIDAEALTDNTVSEDEISDSDTDTDANTQSVEENDTETESNGIPGFSIFTSVFVLAFACLFRKRKN